MATFAGNPAAAALTGAEIVPVVQGTVDSRTTAQALANANEGKALDIASAATTDIGAANAPFAHVTGTVPITALGTVQAGTRRIVRFADILTLTHNAVSLILPTGANIVTAADDVAVFVSEGAGNWRCVGYQRANGTPLVAGAGSGASLGVQFQAETASVADSDPGPGLLKWNNATQNLATFLYLDDTTSDAVTLTGWWSALVSGGFCYIQHATDQNTWQIWDITSVVVAAGYVKLGVALIADGGSFADASPMLVTLEQGAAGGGALTNWTEAANVAAPNATVPAVSFAPNNAAVNVDAVIAVKGTGAFLLDIPDNLAAGGNKRGVYSVDLQTNRNAASQVASGSNSALIGGRQNTASANYSVVVGGSDNLAGNQYAAVVGGYFATASGFYSCVAGGFSSTASGESSFAHGEANLANSSYSRAGGSGSSARSVVSADVYGSATGTAAGTYQRAVYTLRRATTDATPVALTANGGGQNPSNQATLPNGSAYDFTGRVVVREAATGDCASYKFEGTIRRGASAAASALVSAVTVSTVAADTGAAAWAVAVTADTTNGALMVTVTGEAAKSLKWSGKIETVEVVG